MNPNSLITFDRFQTGYGRLPALTEPITCHIPIGARVGVIGANGSGKTTFIKTILGLQRQLNGSYQWRDGATFGYVPQENRLNFLFPITVTDLFKMGMHGELPRLESSSETFENAAREIMDVMEISGLENRLVRELSGGERQRALIARALITRPNVLILDEPFNSLDYNFKQKLWALMSRLREREGLSLILIEHDLNRIINQVDWIMLLGQSGTLYGETRHVISEKNLSAAFQTPVHILRESHGEIQVHFL